MNRLFGSYDDPESKIIPVKIHYGDQIIDKESCVMIQPKLYAPEKGDSAYWQDFDWGLAAEAGMKRVGMEYSGEYKFIETKMYWPINHMVSPASEAVQCAECHTREDGRLAQLTGFYMPGRDNNDFIDNLGLFVVIMSLFGVLGHGALRFMIALKQKNYKTQIIEQD